MSTRARGFSPFAATKRRTRRARTWLANAWIDALEDMSLDSEQLRLGRQLAHSGHVGPITVSPGQVSAVVHGTDHVPYEVTVTLAELSGEEWERLLARIAARADHVAALLDGAIPDELADTADDADVRLLPGAGDLEPRCDCPEWGYPCEHAAAVSYQASWLLDHEPFLLFLLRGHEPEELLAELQQRNSGRQAGAVLDPESVERIVDAAAARADELLSPPPHDHEH
ncbi:hypothetical protein EF847_01160 [Actinobacteria bacterium YIM 96077]|uniref:SWIM-type domain-containing protein n=1 Tax=Phytoactinopolyspora halophila TaxID=1981511 RepID=A0A329R062_9ACTN|nr:SWIM zinc finger family protein [Phytoactinopolyspora halophila]AYY11535.1 hypothetical protein EF847_01160 [Actinobacteria bacterium YIM 96077]RAW17981.1 hypothetical protein DPM12_03845 [Phytoactinopolyspora halophila]